MHHYLRFVRVRKVCFDRIARDCAHWSVFVIGRSHYESAQVSTIRSIEHRRLSYHAMLRAARLPYHRRSSLKDCPRARCDRAH